jgi:uncharacterized membrane protein
MRALMIAVALVYSILGIFFMGPLHAQQQQKFNLAFCNISGAPTIVGVTVQANPGKWQVRGWFGVDNQSCNIVGTYLGPKFYWFATDGEGTWQADANDKNATQQCISPKAAFDFAAGRQCAAAGEVLVYFLGVTVPSDVATYTMTLRK